MAQRKIYSKKFLGEKKSNIEKQETNKNVVVIPQLTVSEQGIPMASSLDVAKVFEKDHKNILRDIENLFEDIPQDFGQLNFEPSSYMNQQNKEHPMYLLTRDAFTLLAMGFTGKKAIQFKIAYIEAFNAMEKALMEYKKKEEEKRIEQQRRIEEAYNAENETPKLAKRYTTNCNACERAIEGIKGLFHFIAFLNNTSYEVIEDYFFKLFGITKLETCNVFTIKKIKNYALAQKDSIINNIEIVKINKLKSYEQAFHGLIAYWRVVDSKLTIKNINNYICNIGTIQNIEKIKTEEQYLRAIFLVYSAILTERIYEE